MSNLLIKNGSVVFPHGVVKTDIVVENGVIAGFARTSALRGAEIIDAEGLLVFPGFVDEHVHFREPGYESKEDFQSGSAAAEAGGVTTVLEMPNTSPLVVDVKELRRKAEIVKDKSFVDYALYGVLIDENIEEIDELYEAGAVGFKAFLGPTTGDIATPSDATIFEALTKSAKKQYTIAFHCENRNLVHYFEQKARQQPVSPLSHLYSRPAICEVDSVRKINYFAAKTGGNVLIVHLSSGEAVDYLQNEKSPNVTVETCPHYLLLDSTTYEKHGTLMKVNPPIRFPEDRSKLVEAVQLGLITNIGSDHAPHTLEEKQRPVFEAPAGMIGVELMGPLLVDAALKGMIPITKISEILAANPARTFGLYPKKGGLTIGSDGDFAIFDPRTPDTIHSSRLHSKQKFTPFDGYKVSATLRYTILRGEVIYRDGKLIDKRIGQWVKH
ncbi:MAG: allantoinase AllB [Candidatus Caldarchaeum sp.]